MRKLCLLFFLYWNVCCTGPVAVTKPAEPAILYDKTVRIDVVDKTPPRNIPWSEHASATVAPLIVPLTTAIKMILP